MRGELKVFYVVTEMAKTVSFQPREGLLESLQAPTRLQHAGGESPCSLEVDKKQFRFCSN